MKNTISGIFFSIIMLSLNAQNNKFSIDLNIPFQPFEDNYIKNNFDGIVDIGFKYNVVNVSKFGIGVSGNFAFFKIEKHNNFIISDVNLLMIRPRISAEIKISKFNPYVGMGYSLFYFHNKYDKSDDFDHTNEGPNINIGVKIHLSTKLYVNLGYDFIKLRMEDSFNQAYNRKIQIVDVGIGLQLTTHKKQQISYEELE